MITFAVMTCTIVNSMLLCINQRYTDFSVQKSAIVSIAEQEYRLVDDLSQATLAHAVTDKFSSRKYQGCKANIKGQDPVYTEFTCKKLKSIIEAE